VDTRTKIVTADEAAVRIARNGRPARIVTGFFDPLLAEHAQRLEELAAPDRTLVALIRTPANALLSARARAELVAGVGVVDLVVIEEGENTLARLGGDEAVREESADERRARAFIEHVRTRY
jgi:hypothetical protein